MNRLPDIEIKIWISDIGIQVDYNWRAEKFPEQSFCRDFTGFHNRFEMIQKLHAWLYSIIQLFVKDH